MTTATAKAQAVKKRKRNTKHIVYMKDIEVTSAELISWFPSASWNVSRHAWRVGDTLFVEPRFTLDGDDAHATGEV